MLGDGFSVHRWRDYRRRSGGASEPARKFANAFVKIPMAGNIESLNAAAAGSVLMFEVIVGDR